MNKQCVMCWKEATGKVEEIPICYDCYCGSNDTEVKKAWNEINASKKGTEE